MRNPNKTEAPGSPSNASTVPSSSTTDRFRALAENNAVGIWQISPTGETLYVNPAMLRMLELECPEDLADRTFHSFFTPETLPLMAGEHAKRPAGLASNYEATLIGQRGRKLDVLICGTPNFNPDGTLQSLIGTFLDNTARKQAEESARKSDELFRAIVRDQTELISRWKPDGTLTFVNEAYVRHFGKSAEELVGRSFFPFIHEEDRERIRRKILSITPANPTATDTHRSILASGKISWQEWTDRGLFNDEGNLVELQSVGRDITERIEAGEALRRSEEKYRNLVETSKDFIWSVDLEGRFTFLNQAVHSMLGYQPAELLGKSFLDLVPPDQVAKDLVAFQNSLKTGISTMDYETRLVKKDGSIVFLSANATVIRDPQGKPLGVTGISKDISERIRAEKALKESEKRYELVIAGSSAALWDWNLLNGKIYYAPRFRELLGYASDELPAGEDGWYDYVHTEDRDKVRESLRAHLDSRIPYMVEFRLRTKSGAYRWFEGRAQALWDDSGKPYRMAGSITDITERKLAEQALRDSEERFRQLARAMDEVFWMRSIAPERVLYVSPAFSRIWGVSTEALYETPSLWLDLIIPEDRERVRATFENFLKSESVQTYSAEYRLQSSDGPARWIYDKGSKILDRDGKPYRLCGLARDITERKHAEESHSALMAKLQQSQKMDAIGRLAGGIAHDFNNLLTAIAGNARMARQDISPTHPLQENLAEIENASGRATELVKQILAFSRRQEMERKPLNPSIVVADAVKFLRSTLPATVEIQATLDPDLPSVLANATQINQVLMNLATNAAHAMHNTGILALTLNAVVVDPATASTIPDLQQGKYVRLTVKDNGPGIGATILPHIFEPFFTTKAAGQGTGLGLSVVHGIVKSHGGAITVDSEVGKGTTFQLFFPIVEAPVPPPAPTADKDVRGQGERILFVDDEHSIVFITSRMLRRLGYTVTGFTNPLEALAAFQSNPDQFDLVVTDMSMPYMDGPRLIGEIQKIRPELPIVMTTGYIRPEDVESAKRLGIEDLILKPNTINELSQALHEILARRLKTTKQT
jgi:PAS domain S-box-containing protein